MQTCYNKKAVDNRKIGGGEPLKEKYYRTNAMYEYIEKNKLRGYTLAKENIWLMVYGDPESIPRLLLVISAVPEERYENMDITPRERGVMELAARFAGETGLEYRVVRYCRDWPLDKVQYMEYPSRHAVIGINALKQLFERNGVKGDPLPGGDETSKELNDRAASAFHIWQRENLGNITASDIDLIAWKNRKPARIYELKRSYIVLEEWKPFARDFANFRLIARFAKKIGADFQIVYNRRTKNPYFDDIRRLKRFAFFPEEGRAEYIDTIALGDFFGGA